MEYIIRLSEDYEKCERVLNKLGIVAYVSPVIDGLIFYWSKLDIEYLEKRDFIGQIEIAPKGTFVSYR
ncbi:hypothetical protein [Paenibacillus sp. 1781tsa1]|uniref:hypothetical protein n=1 Tax=Paenibacillus sp. 1781tsa1 TaxID=2953810 RepID=UPI0020A1B9C9|nr:hypothetical protein [Paenibacillus sp. 1781tsa1]MCP1184992.1 hypothetical protein [Paenibacillus sp. 1781tsa1]